MDIENFLSINLDYECKFNDLYKIYIFIKQTGAQKILFDVIRFYYYQFIFFLCIITIRGIILIWFSYIQSLNFKEDRSRIFLLKESLMRFNSCLLSQKQKEKTIIIICLFCSKGIKSIENNEKLKKINKDLKRVNLFIGFL